MHDKNPYMQMAQSAPAPVQEAIRAFLNDEKSLQQFARERDVALHTGEFVGVPSQWAAYDIIVGSKAAIIVTSPFIVPQTSDATSNRAMRRISHAGGSVNAFHEAIIAPNPLIARELLRHLPKAKAETQSVA